jgi:hypothetical protein
MSGDESSDGGKTGDDPLDAFRDDSTDIDEDAEGKEALGRPEDIKPGQRRIVDDKPASN